MSVEGEKINRKVPETAQAENKDLKGDDILKERTHALVIVPGNIYK